MTWARTVLVLLLTTGCGDDNPAQPPCDSAIECVRGRDEGVCVKGGCAYEDQICQGGYRYAEDSPRCPGCCFHRIDAPFPPDAVPIPDASDAQTFVP